MPKPLNISTIIATVFVLFFLNACVDKKSESQQLLRKANIELYKSRLDNALELYEKATELDPENPEGWYGMGVVWLNRQQYEKAIPNFDKAIDLKSDYTDAFFNRGQAYFYMGDIYKACDSWQVAFDLGKPNMEDKLRKCER